MTLLVLGAVVHALARDLAAPYLTVVGGVIIVLLAGVLTTDQALWASPIRAVVSPILCNCCPSTGGRKKRKLLGCR